MTEQANNIAKPGYDSRLRFLVESLPIYPLIVLVGHFLRDSMGMQNALFQLAIVAVVALVYSRVLAAQILRRVDNERFVAFASTSKGQMIFMWLAVTLIGLVLYVAWESFINVPTVSTMFGIPSQLVIGVPIVIMLISHIYRGLLQVRTKAVDEAKE